MKLQKNLLLIPMAFALIWGIFGLLAPETLQKFLATPPDHVNADLLATGMVLAVSQISLGIIAGWMRTINDKKMMSGAMTVIAIVFLLFGLEGVLVDVIVQDMARNMIIFSQGIVFLILSGIFYIKRAAD